MRTFLYWLDVASPGELAALVGYIALCAAAYLACGLARHGRPTARAVLTVLAGLAAALALCALSWDGLYFRAGEFRSSFPEGFLPLLLLPATLALALGMIKLPRIVAPALGVFWLGVLAVSAVMKGREGDGWDRLVYDLFILVGTAGAVSSLLVTLSLRAFRKGAQGPLKKAALGAAWGCNAAFYLFVALLFPVNRDWLLIPAVLWALSAALALISLLVLCFKKGAFHGKRE